MTENRAWYIEAKSDGGTLDHCLPVARCFNPDVTMAQLTRSVRAAKSGVPATLPWGEIPMDLEVRFEAAEIYVRGLMDLADDAGDVLALLGKLPLKVRLQPDGEWRSSKQILMEWRRAAARRRK